jgi:hypothetical protein
MCQFLNIKFRAVGAVAVAASSYGSSSGSTLMMRLLAVPAQQHCYSIVNLPPLPQNQELRCVL